jgi:uncharacterized protein YcaQ
MAWPDPDQIAHVLIHNRVRAVELFDFDYSLEMYKPAADCRWGSFALQVLHGDRLVGKADVIADRRASVLRVHAIHQYVGFPRPLTRQCALIRLSD